LIDCVKDAEIAESDIIICEYLVEGKSKFKTDKPEKEANKKEKETVEMKEIKNENPKEKEEAKINVCSHCGKESEKLQVCECNTVRFLI